MQAIGLMNHHAHDCDAFQRCEEQYEAVRRMFEQYAEERVQQQQNESDADVEEKAEVAADMEEEEVKDSGVAKADDVSNGRKRMVKRQKMQTAVEGTAVDGAVSGRHTSTATKRGGQPRDRKKRAAVGNNTDKAEEEEKSSVQESVSRGRRTKTVVGATKQGARA